MWNTVKSVFGIVAFVVILCMERALGYSIMSGSLDMPNIYLSKYIAVNYKQFHFHFSFIL